MNEETFRNARNRVLSEETTSSGIGTLSEKTLHRILKLAEEPDESLHEVKFLGSVADICRPDEIVEIQTSSYAKLVPKLEKFLPERKVTVICPLAKEKTVRRIDPVTGEIGKGRKSPKHQTLFDAGRELFAIRRFFDRPGFTLRAVSLDVEEYRLPDGRNRRGKTRFRRLERIPNRLLSVEDLSGEDFRSLIPSTLPEKFTAKQFAKEIRVSSRLAHTWLRIFSDLGFLAQCGKDGRAFLFERT